MKSFQEASIALIKEKPFFGHLIMMMRKNFTTKIPTAGVQITSEGITLHINLEFFDRLSIKGRKAVLEHECLHCLQLHPARFKQKVGKVTANIDQSAMTEAETKQKAKEHVQDYLQHKTANIAMDTSINQYITDFDQVVDEEGKQMGITLSALKEQMNIDAKAEMQWEYYYGLIKGEQKKNGQDIDNFEFDDHSEWENTDVSDAQAEAKIKRICKVAKDMSDGKGLTPGQNELLKNLLEGKVDWKKQLRTFVASANDTFIESTRKKRNRRYGIVYPGIKHEHKMHLAVAVDTSGSISAEQLSLFFGEIRKMSGEVNAEISVIEADAEVTQVYTYVKGKTPTPKGGGGTAYSPALLKAKELGCDVIVYMGDMDAADTPKNPGIPVLWCIVGKSSPPANFGRSIYIEE